jgi:hypothetical protein
VEDDQASLNMLLENIKDIRKPHSIIIEHMQFPNKIYSIKHRNTFLGCNTRTELQSSIVFAFSNRDDALMVREKIKKLSVIPKISYQKPDFILHKRIPSSLEMQIPIEPDELFVLEHKSKPFIIKLGLNTVDTLLVNEVQESRNIIRFHDYEYICIKEVSAELVAANLQKIYLKSSS